MQRNGNNNDNSILILIVIIVGVAVLGLWELHVVTGLDMTTIATTIMGGAVVLMLGIGSWKFGDEIELIRLRNLLPILAGLLWVSVWPVLNDYASQTFSYRYGGDASTVWWAAGYTKLGVLVAIVGGGYLINWFQRDRY